MAAENSKFLNLLVKAQDGDISRSPVVKAEGGFHYIYEAEDPTVKGKDEGI